MLQAALTAVLVMILIGALVSVTAAGLLQAGRRRRLARLAHEAAMRFSSDDPFDVPRRYGLFALVAHGHSPRAHNVAYGHRRGRPIRAFDFRYELGHGPRRTSRRFSVMVSRLARPVGRVLMWHGSHREQAPPAVLASEYRTGEWLCQGDRRISHLLADCCEKMGEPVSIEMSGEILMLMAPTGGGHRDYGGYLRLLDEVVACVEAGPSGYAGDGGVANGAG
jgi:hypothetical protein